MSEALRDAEALVERLRIHNSQLERALESRIVIEQAKGVLAELEGLDMPAAYRRLLELEQEQETGRSLTEVAETLISQAYR